MPIVPFSILVVVTLLLQGYRNFGESAALGCMPIGWQEVPGTKSIHYQWSKTYEL